jgi:hypothetical protein
MVMKMNMTTFVVDDDNSNNYDRTRTRYRERRRGRGFRSFGFSSHTICVVVAVAIVFSLASLVQRVHSLPQFVVINGRPKCFTVEVPKMTMLKVHYNAPGT